MNDRFGSGGILYKQRLRAIENWALPALENLDQGIDQLQRDQVKTDHASTIANLRDALARAIDAAILEVRTSY